MKFRKKFKCVIFSFVLHVQATMKQQNFKNQLNKENGLRETMINRHQPWWVRYKTWNDEWRPFVKKRTHLIGISTKLLLMRNFPTDQPIVEEQSEDSYAAWLERKRSDDKEPWLFLGEDEDFISAAWIQLTSPKPFTPRSRQEQVAGYTWTSKGQGSPICP